MNRYVMYIVKLNFFIKYLYVLLHFAKIGKLLFSIIIILMTNTQQKILTWFEKLI